MYTHKYPYIIESSCIKSCSISSGDVGLSVKES